ncbi:hypothetical protein HYQ46_006872 [Verticillium longisporum]|nr:hypothetical protein HYQ46_006872 [Verticillium longisporum]
MGRIRTQVRHLVRCPRDPILVMLIARSSDWWTRPVEEVTFQAPGEEGVERGGGHSVSSSYRIQRETFQKTGRYGSMLVNPPSHLTIAAAPRSRQGAALYLINLIWG